MNRLKRSHLQHDQVRYLHLAHSPVSPFHPNVVPSRLRASHPSSNHGNTDSETNSDAMATSAGICCLIFISRIRLQPQHSFSQAEAKAEIGQLPASNQVGLTAASRHHHDRCVPKPEFAHAHYSRYCTPLSQDGKKACEHE